jgi:universal stress protein A
MQMESGDPAAEIARVAEEGGYDLILVGSHSRSAVGELLLGSVSKALVRIAPCPVLVVGKGVSEQFRPTARP